MISTCMAGICPRRASELGNNAQLAALLGITVMGEIEPLVPWGELTMPVPGLELASGLKRVWDVSRYGVAIPT